MESLRFIPGVLLSRLHKRNAVSLSRRMSELLFVKLGSKNQGSVTQKIDLKTELNSTLLVSFGLMIRFKVVLLALPPSLHDLPQQRCVVV